MEAWKIGSAGAWGLGEMQRVFLTLVDRQSLAEQIVTMQAKATEWDK